MSAEEIAKLVALLRISDEPLMLHAADALEACANNPTDEEVAAAVFHAYSKWFSHNVQPRKANDVEFWARLGRAAIDAARKGASDE
jgi:hypothetical protein